MPYQCYISFVTQVFFARCTQQPDLPLHSWGPKFKDAVSCNKGAVTSNCFLHPVLANQYSQNLFSKLDIKNCWSEKQGGLSSWWLFTPPPTLPLAFCHCCWIQWNPYRRTILVRPPFFKDHFLGNLSYHISVFEWTSQHLTENQQSFRITFVCLSGWSWFLIFFILLLWSKSGCTTERGGGPGSEILDSGLKRGVSTKPGTVQSGAASWHDCGQAFHDELRASLFSW